MIEGPILLNGNPLNRDNGGQREGGASVANGSQLSKQQATAAGVVADVVQELTAGCVCEDEEACVMVCPLILHTSTKVLLPKTKMAPSQT